jgi:hypothetical protein
MNRQIFLLTVAIAGMALLAWSAEIPGDFGHQRGGSTQDPDGNPKGHPEMVWFEAPAGHTATVARDNWEKRAGYWEAKIVVYKNDAMRIALSYPN